MRLVKFCKRAHKEEALNKGIIFIANISYQKSNPNPSVRDDESYSKITFKTTSKTPQVFPKEYMKSFGIYAPTTVNKGGTIHLTQPKPDLLVFSTSIHDRHYKDRMNKMGYDSAYEISLPKLFFNKVAETIMSNLPPLLTIGGIHRKITYTDIPVFNDAKDLMKHIPSYGHINFNDYFTKSIQFSHEKEYRFCWFIVDNSHRLFLLNAPGMIIQNMQLTEHFRDLV